MVVVTGRGRLLPCLATMRLAMQSGTLVTAARNVMPMITSGIPRVKPMIVTCTHTHTHTQDETEIPER